MLAQLLPWYSNQIIKGRRLYQPSQVHQGFDQEIWYGDTMPVSTPMSTSIKLDSNEKDKSVDIKIYRSMIGSLLYLTANRIDIMFSICLCARF